MSLSADEKLRVAHALDDLGVHFIEAGFPSSNPKEEALFDLLSRETFESAEIAAFGMTRRRDAEAAEDEALRFLADCFAPVCTLVGKTWSLHLEKVTRVDPEENLRMIEDSVGVPPRPGQAGGLRRRALLRRMGERLRLRPALPARRGRRGRGERDPVRHQRRHASHRRRRGHEPRGGRAGRQRAGGDPHPRRRRLWGGQRAGGCRVRRAPRAGHDERLRRALRQRQPRDDPGRPPAQARAATACRPSGSGGSPRPLTWWTSCATWPPTPTSPTWGPTPSPTRAACTWRA